MQIGKHKYVVTMQSIIIDNLQLNTKIALFLCSYSTVIFCTCFSNSARSPRAELRILVR